MTRQKIIVIGAGMAGLLAGNVLRRHELQIVEKQPELPNNHHAVLRFRSTRVADACHIPFREVRVFKACDEPDPIKAAMLYAHKVTGKYEVRSLINLEPCTRWIAPTDLVEQMAASLTIAYGVDGIGYLSPDERRQTLDIPIISTLPMPMLMDALEYEGERPDFESSPGFTLSCTIGDCDMFATRYFTCPLKGTLYRASITGDKLIAEYVGKGNGRSGLLSYFNWDVAQMEWIAKEFGVHPRYLSHFHFNSSRYAKLAHLSPLDRKRAQDFMFWASSNWNVYSLGRFATWRAGLLLDDVVGDVLQIEKWIGGTTYDMLRGLRK